MKLKTKVWANTVNSATAVMGTLIKKHKGAKGEWWEIKPDAGGKNFKTRPACVIEAS